MRFLFYDTVTHIEKGRSFIGVKNFSLSEEFLRGHYAELPIVPGVIFIEAMAQLLGWLIIYSHDFRLTAIMSLIEGVTVTPTLRPGFKPEIHARIVSTSKRDFLGMAQIFAGERCIASLNRMIYSHFHDVNPEGLRQRFRYYSGIS